MTRWDAIVVGSGPSGAWAAAGLVERGLRVLMLDSGSPRAPSEPDIPEVSFDEIRRSEPDQARYLLGDAFECVSFDGVRTGGQLTPPRLHVGRLAPTLTPIRSTTFEAMEGLAFGGLGAAWAAVAVPWDDSDLAGMPLGRDDLAPHLQAVVDRIGLSGDTDLAETLGGPAPPQPALPSEPLTEAMLQRYASRRGVCSAAGLVVGRPWLAALSQPLGERRGHALLDLDFYADVGRSVWRPQHLVEELVGAGSLVHEHPWLVGRFEEVDGGVQVEARHLDTGESRRFEARTLVLAAGALGSARIALRSLDAFDVWVSLVTNRLRYVPCLDPRWLGRPNTGPRHSLAQALMLYRPPGSATTGLFVQTHCYRSLMLWKLVRESPLSARESLRILRNLNPAMAVLSLYHPEKPGPQRRCRLLRGDPEELEVEYAHTASETRRQDRMERGLLRQVLRLGWLPMRRLDARPGASIHYAGTLPMTTEDRPLTTDPTGLLRGTERVYVADGAAMAHLPAKPPTLTLMANARRVALGLPAG